MAFVATDPRAKLAGTPAASAPEQYGTAEYVKFYETDPQIQTETESTWLARGQNFVIAYSQLAPGAVLERTGHPDEYVILVPDPGTPVEVSAGEETTTADGNRVIIVPPGTSTLRAEQGGRVVRVFSAQAADLADQASNAASYRNRKPNLPDFAPWPEPPGGYRLHSYDLDVAAEEGRFGRIWRCTTSMVNYSYPRMGPRDVGKMSPHVHADFEQCSLILDGSFVHHIRWPWGTDMRHWRPDEHEICAGPSVTVIPPGTIHTSQQVSSGLNQLVDIFAPPRTDFSRMDGWVLNADEYPMPEGE